MAASTAAAAAPMAQTNPQPRPRLWFLDNLKVALTVLVILHHVGQPYGPTGGFWYFEDGLSHWALGPFFRINASFFMGLFFLISAYFLPGSYDRKGAGAFLKDRLIRLGIPIAFFFLTVIPVLMYLSYINFRGGDLPFLTYYAQVFFGLGAKPAGFVGPSWPDMQFAHLWFVQHLLAYALLYAGLRALWPKTGGSLGQPAFRPAPPPGDAALMGLVVLMAVATFLVRIPFPIDRWIGFLGFIQMEVAHMPQYASLFLLGALAYRKGWLQSLPTAVGMRWLWLGLGAAALYAVLTPTGHWWGTVPGFVDALWESLVAVGLSAGLITLFRERYNRQSSLGRKLGENAFGAYLFHVPVAVAIQFAMAGVALGALAKFLVVGAAAVPLSFLVSDLVRRLPGARSVL